MDKLLLKAKCESLALKLMFGSTTKVDLASILEKEGLQYRSKKSFSDVHHALYKARKYGDQKSEFELDLFGLYLTGIFKGAQT